MLHEIKAACKCVTTTHRMVDRSSFQSRSCGCSLNNHASSERYSLLADIMLLQKTSIIRSPQQNFLTSDEVTTLLFN